MEASGGRGKTDVTAQQHSENSQSLLLTLHFGDVISSIYLSLRACAACVHCGCGCALRLTGVEGIDGLEVLGVESDGLRLHHHDLGLDLHG